MRVIGAGLRGSLRVLKRLSVVTAPQRIFRRSRQAGVLNVGSKSELLPLRLGLCFILRRGGGGLGALAGPHLIGLRRSGADQCHYQKGEICGCYTCRSSDQRFTDVSFHFQCALIPEKSRALAVPLTPAADKADTAMPIPQATCVGNFRIKPDSRGKPCKQRPSLRQLSLLPLQHGQYP